jgi:hypothetical protein
VLASVLLSLASTVTGAVQFGSPLADELTASRSVGEPVDPSREHSVLALRVADPAGGLPWGLRVERTTAGRTCLQVGRVDGGELGALGRDGAFSDDGRFHPLPAGDLAGPFACGLSDATGKEFLNVALRDVPASGLAGLSGGARLDGGCSPRLSAASGGLQRCPTADMRDLYYGLLGTSAVSYTHVGSDGTLQATPTSGPDGAYLVVLPARAGGCAGPTAGHAHAQAGRCGSELPEADAGSEPLAEAVVAVHYRDGQTLQTGTL